ERLRTYLGRRVPVQGQAMTDTPFGLSLTMATPCRHCNGTSAIIGAGKGPHAASIVCACKRFVAWMPKARLDFICEAIRVWGWPEQPASMAPLLDVGGSEDIHEPTQLKFNLQTKD